ncbi:MAG: hypothetical protein ACPGQL_05010 [Thermoplasmatota archaeon]
MTSPTNAPEAAPEAAPDTEMDLRTLLSLTGYMALVAAVLLVLFILPAEYNIDPTGVGQGLGLTQLAAPSSDVGIHAIEEEPFTVQNFTVTIPAGVGLEFKVILEEGSGIVYNWQADGMLYTDFHGEPTDSTGYFQSYQVHTDRRGDGSFHAPFEGTHGWYWRNDNGRDITIELLVAGHYEVKGIV